MRYWPLIRSALLRRPLEASLILLAVTFGFALFGFMIAMNATVNRVIDGTRDDRLYVNSRFSAPLGLPVGLEQQIKAMNGVTGVGAFRWVDGYYQNPRNGAGVFTVDEGMRVAMAEYPISASQWDELFSTGTGILVTRKAAKRFGLHKGDTFHISIPPGTHPNSGSRDDGARSWAFQVLEIVPDVPQWDGGVIIGNYRYTENARPPASRGYVVGFSVAVQDARRVALIARQIDHRFANSGTPTISVPQRAAAEAMAKSGVSIASMTWGVGTAGLFMIVFLTGNSIAQSVRRRIPEFATLKAMGYTDARVMRLVLIEAAIPCCLGAALGTGLAAAFVLVPPRYIPQGLSNVPHPAVTVTTLESALVFALLIAFFGSVLPIRRLWRLDVAAAIGGRAR